jgi:methionyl-tRNA formyltransferase
MLEVLQDLPRYQNGAWVQKEAEATQAPKIYKELGYIRWHKHKLEEIFLLWRALGQSVGVHTAFTQTGSHRVRLWKILAPGMAAPPSSSSGYVPGMIKMQLKPGMLRFCRRSNFIRYIVGKMY